MSTAEYQSRKRGFTAEARSAQSGRYFGFRISDFKFVFLCALCVSAVSLLLWPIKSDVTAAEKIRVAFVSPSATQSPVWIAKEAGFFAKQGLDAEVLLLPGSPRMVQTLISGDIDYAIVGATAAMRARMRGADVVMLATTANMSNMKLLVGRDSGIRQLEDLKGKTLGVSQYGSDADGFARIVLDKAGLKPDKDVPVIQLGGHPQVAAAIAAGKIPAGVLGGLALLTAQKSGATLLTSGAKLKTVALSGTLATTGSRIQRNRDSVMRFMRAFVEAVRYFKSNPDGTLPILQKYMGGINNEQARVVYEEALEVFEDLPVPAERGIQAVLDRESDPKAKNFKQGDFIDLSFLREIDRSGLVDKIYRK
jgi:NitT/TauT family transport system substrate-binding protein